jgi:hypothetical protein
VATQARPIALILDHADLLVPAAPAGVVPLPEQAIVLEALQRAAVDPRLDAIGHAVVLIARSGDVHRAVLDASGFRTVRVPLPDTETLQDALDLLEKRASDQPDRYAPLASDLTVAAAVRASSGLRVDDLVRASRQAAARRTSVGSAELGKRKAASIERQARGVLRLHPEGRTLDDVAGLAHIRRYVAERTTSGTWPQSLLFNGPPGVGKTFVVRAIASRLGRPAVAFHLVRSPWVGETEANTARALEVIDTLAPIVVHIDEADRAIGERTTGPSADGGTSERFQAALWEFTGEGAARPDVLFCLTTNRADLLDEAQRSRVEVIPILHPTPRDVAQLLPALARQLGRRLDDDLDVYAVARHPKLRITSARHLLRILGRAVTLAHLQAGQRTAPIAHGHLIAAIDDYLPHTNPLEEELMALTALSRTSFRSLLPWVAAEDEGLPREVPYYVEPLLDAVGNLDQDRLRARLAELADQVAAGRDRKVW